MKHYYKLTVKEKYDIAQNLIDIIEKDISPSKETVTFIFNWISSDRHEKFKAYYDVWEIVLKNFIPKTQPILFRGISRKSKHEYIACFTDSAYSAMKFAGWKGYWIICDTSCLPISGEYRNAFYPLSEVLKKAKIKGGWGFTERFLTDYSREGEYIMKIDFSVMHLLKYVDQ